MAIRLTGMHCTGVEPTYTEPSNDYNLAVKMMFNYDIESNADRILQAMMKETVPARAAETNQGQELWQNG